MRFCLGKIPPNEGFHPGNGLSRESVVGIWPSRGVAYAHYDGEISRNRFLFMGALPFLVLSFGPVALFWITGRVLLWLAFLAIFNGIGSAFDLLVIGICLTQVPHNAVLRNKGWLTYWRPGNPGTVRRGVTVTGGGEHSICSPVDLPAE